LFQYICLVPNICHILRLHRLDEYGVPYLQFFLKQCNTLTALDVSNNQMGDFLCGDVLQCLARPPLDFDDGDGKAWHSTWYVCALTVGCRGTT
jgi:hypothetical protein